MAGKADSGLSPVRKVRRRAHLKKEPPLNAAAPFNSLFLRIFRTAAFSFSAAFYTRYTVVFTHSQFLISVVHTQTFLSSHLYLSSPVLKSTVPLK